MRKNTSLQPGTVVESESDTDDEALPVRPKPTIRSGRVESYDSSSSESSHEEDIRTGIPESDEDPDSSRDQDLKDLIKQIKDDTSTSNEPEQPRFELPSEILDAYHEQRLRPYTWGKELKEKASKLLYYDPITFACCVCMENYYKTDEYGKCSNAFHKKKNTIHTICRACLVRATLPENVNLDQKGKGIRCPTGDCENVILMSEVQRFMEERHKEQLLERIEAISIAAAELSDFYRCPDCAFAMIVDDKKPNYQCYNCKRSNCKNCDREYIGDHVGRTCVELVEYERRARHQAKA